MKFLLLAALTLPAAAAHADGTRGGGAQIEAAFRLRAVELIRAIADSPDADQLCAASAMSAGLRSVKIRIVDALVDPATGTAPADKNLDAFTSAGDMQLLRAAWTGFLDPSKASFSRSVDVLVLHEVYRSTGTCDDEGFQISDRILSLLTRPSRYAQVFGLIASQPGLRLASGDDDRKRLAYCDGKAEPGSTATCVFLWPKSDVQQDFGFRLVRGVVESTAAGPALRESFSLQMRPLLVAEFAQLSNLLAFASEQRPFFVVFDLQYGLWAYGFDLNNLIKLP